jgi:hypothetical protein
VDSRLQGSSALSHAYVCESKGLVVVRLQGIGGWRTMERLTIGGKKKLEGGDLEGLLGC